MRHFPKLAFIMLAAAFAAGCVTPGGTTSEAAASDPIVIAIQPTDNADAIQDKADELEAFLSEHVGKDVEVIVPLTSTGVIEALRFGHADAAFMGAWPAVLANTKAGADIVLAEKRDVIHGEEAVVAPYYFSYYVVMEDSPYQTLEDVRGKTVAYASLTSTSGYIFPVAKLVENGLISQPEAGKEANPGEFFGDVKIAGGYAQAWEALKSGQVDVAVTAGDINAKLYHEVLNGTRIIETQGPVPSHAVVFAKDFEGEDRDALKAALLELKGEKKDLMRKLVSGIFVEFMETTTDEHAAKLKGALDLAGFRFAEKLG